MNYEAIKVIRQEGVTWVRFNRPEKKNAMNPTLHREMHRALTELEHDAETRVVVITGNGDSFCAGEDLKQYFYELKDKPVESEQIRRISYEWRGRLLRLLSKPTIACVNGWCFGGGFAVVGNCDLALAAEEAKFGLSEINFGNFPGGVVPRVILDTLRWREVMYYSLTGEMFDGRRAAEIGLVNFAVPRDRLEDETVKLARRLLEKDALALKETKEVLRIGRHMNDEETWYWAQAKGHELTHLQKAGWLEKGIVQFSDKQYRPGFQSFKKD
ncbi:MAG TPA: p-hydroxycinnamoyl CoA hydratase/lyase [Candidatus Eisenbacteria bacterium]|nr:p-hydroxycinnamoyl CoA hydratase/lyase [Candidatus Eisenbacteria bacterium]